MAKMALSLPKHRSAAEREKASAAIRNMQDARTAEEVMACLDTVPPWVLDEVPEYRQFLQREILPAALRALKATAARGSREAAECLFDVLTRNPHLRNAVADTGRDG